MSSVVVQAAVLAALFASNCAAQAKPGEVETQLKLDALSAGLAGQIDAGDRFGHAVATVGDLDGDGHGDIVVGAPWDDDGGPERGAVWILFLNGDGTIKSTAKISDTADHFLGGLQDFAHFGNAVTYLGDLDDDGTGDIAVSAVGDDDAGLDSGAVWILFLLPDGSVQRYQKLSALVGAQLEPGDRFGSALAGLPDVGGDGVFDLAVGASADDDGGVDQGCVYILALSLDGRVKQTTTISETAGGFGGDLKPGDHFGASIASLGDSDGDGLGDLLVGAELNDDATVDSGGVWLVRLQPDGSVKSQVEIAYNVSGFTGPLSAGDHFGAAVAPVGDLDGDATLDAAVGAILDDDGGNAHGAAWLLFLDESGHVNSFQKISSTEGQFAGPLADGSHFGMLGSIGDLDGDGANELAVGAPGDATGGDSSGALWILSVHTSNWLDLDHALVGTAGAPKLQGSGTLLPGSEVQLIFTHGKPLAPALVVLGGSVVNLPFFGGVLVPAPGALAGPTQLDYQGYGTLHGRWPPDALPGVSVWMQAWIVDAAGPQGYAATNALQATSP